MVKYALVLLSAPSRPGRLPLIHPLNPNQVLRERPPARPVAPSTELFIDCSEIPGNVSPAEAPVILSQPRTGTADYYELIWEPRHDGGAPVLEYVVKYRKVKALFTKFIPNRNAKICSCHLTYIFCLGLFLRLATRSMSGPYRTYLV